MNRGLERLPRGHRAALDRERPAPTAPVGQRVAGDRDKDGDRLVAAEGGFVTRCPRAIPLLRYPEANAPTSAYTTKPSIEQKQ